jgi:hypothetical protein
LGFESENGTKWRQKEASYRLEQAKAVASDFVKALDKHTAVLANQLIHITASLGVASFENLSDLEVMEHADVAMYGAKQAGRNRYVVYQALLGERDRGLHGMAKPIGCAGRLKMINSFYIANRS